MTDADVAPEVAADEPAEAGEAAALDRSGDDDALDLVPARGGRGPRGTGGSFEGYSPRGRLLLSIATGVAGAVAFAGAAMVTDAQVDEGEADITVTNDARATPILVPAASATGFAAVGGSYGTAEWALATREAVLGAWGAVDPAEQATGGAGGGEDGEVDPSWLLADPRVTDPGAPVFADACLDDERDPALAVPCPTELAARGVILEGRSVPPNRVEVVAFPHGDVDAARDCDFSGAGADDIPLVVVTANPGEVQVVVGEGDAAGEPVVVESPDDEVDQWEDWMERPVGVRPRSSFVSHCLTVPRPEGDDLVRVRATADDEGDELVTAEVWVGRLGDGDAPVTVTPLDSTLARIDLGLPSGRARAEVVAVPRSLLGATTSCDRVGDDVLAAVADGWRRGATTVTSPGSDPARPWSEGLPRVQRTTVPLWEGEANLVCLRVTGGDGVESADLWISPPDARRLVLGVTQVQAQAEIPGPINVAARFVELGWTPCAVEVAVQGTGISTPGSAGLMCSSGGDVGPLDGGGSVAELTVQVGDGAVHRGRIVLSARPGAGGVRSRLAAEESYRLPIPRPDLRGALCVPGAESPGCEPADATNILGSIVITARWNDGATGGDAWSVSTTRP